MSWYHQYIPGYAKLEAEVKTLREDKRKAVREVAALENELAAATDREAMFRSLASWLYPEASDRSITTGFRPVAVAGFVLDVLMERGRKPDWISRTNLGGIAMTFLAAKWKYVVEFGDGGRVLVHAVGGVGLDGDPVDLTDVEIPDLADRVIATIDRWESAGEM